MKRPESSTREALWEHAKPELEHAIGLCVYNGVKVKGLKSKDALIHVLCEIAKGAYQSGLDRGYDLGARVFGDESDVDDS